MYFFFFNCLHIYVICISWGTNVLLLHLTLVNNLRFHAFASDGTNCSPPDINLIRSCPRASVVIATKGESNSIHFQRMSHLIKFLYLPRAQSSISSRISHFKYHRKIRFPSPPQITNKLLGLWFHVPSIWVVGSRKMRVDGRGNK